MKVDSKFQDFIKVLLTNTQSLRVKNRENFEKITVNKTVKEEQPLPSSPEKGQNIDITA